MPKHEIGLTYKDDAGAMPLGTTVYLCDTEVNSILPVPAGAVSKAFGLSWLKSKIVCYGLAVGTQTATQVTSSTWTEPTAGQLIVNVNQATFGGIAAPGVPSPTTATSGGTVLAGTYPVVQTYVNAQGETTASVAGTVTTTGSTSTITVPSPGAVSGATGWYAYVGQAGAAASTATRQQASGSPTAIGTALTLTAPPTSTGALPSVFNTTATNPQIVLNAKAALAYAPNIAGTVNQFNVDVTGGLFISNPGVADLVLATKIGLNY